MIRDGRLWPWAMALVLGLTMGANLLVFRLARGDASFAVEPDYYAKAVAWDSTRALDARSDALGWTVNASLAPMPATETLHLAVHLHTAEGTPVQGATVSVEASHNARGSRVLSDTLRSTSPGTWESMLPSSRTGLWEVRVTAIRGRDHFRRTLRLDTASPAHNPTP